MSQDDDDEQYNKYLEDPRIPCQYGAKCYQKNPLHQKKYKHPPKTDQKTKKVVKKAPGQKRKAEKDTNDIPKKSPFSPEVKHTDKKINQNEDPVPECSSSPGEESEKIGNLKIDSRDSEKGSEGNSRDELSPSPEKEIEKEEIVDKISKTINLSPSNIKTTIFKLFLTEMPEDFYKFYEFCEQNSPSDPTSAFKIIDIKLVGPFDILSGKLHRIKDKDDFLKHWRYYYDPPEFQTVLKGNDKDGLHFGYWRDDPNKMPIFVAKNSSNVSCQIDRVAENLFGALDSYLEERTKLSNPFEKATIARLHQKLKSFAKEQKINLDKYSSNMKAREGKVVARTLHGAGIVVPYDRKTQVGYRKLAMSETDLKRVFKILKDTETDEKRTSAMSELQEVTRWATIAADECDFGTCLELGHDLFSSGLPQVENIALQMFSMSYGLLSRPEFLKIAQVHFKERKKGSSLSVL